jgi:uncharacterized membrane protein (UPF0127 family)
MALDGVVSLRRVGGQTLAARVTIARSFWQRFRGLMLRRELPPGEGLYLPGSDVHMFFMRFPIDCLFLAPPTPDGERRAVGLRHGLPPWRGIVWYVRGAQGVVELPAGTLAAAGVAVGDRFRLEPGP